MHRLANVKEAIFLEVRFVSLKEKNQEVEKSKEKLVIANNSFYTNYKLLRSIREIGVINAIVLQYVTDPYP